MAFFFSFLRKDSPKEKPKDKEKEREREKEKDKEREREKEKEKEREREKAKKKLEENAVTPVPGKVTEDDFEIGDKLGNGSFGKVVLCRHKGTRQIYALKIVEKASLLAHSRQNDVYTERNILSRANHPFLMKLHCTFQSSTAVFFVLEYMPGGDLNNYLNSKPKKVLDLYTTKVYLMEILLAILFLHANRVIYRDLKPENILLTHDGHCALADFGLSKDFHGCNEEELRTKSFVGSPYYVAPEVLSGKEYANSVDFWSFGVLAYRMFIGRPPFQGKSFHHVFDAISNSPASFPPNVSIPDEAKDLILRLLIKDPNKRYQGESVKNHSFWNGINWDDVYAKKVELRNWVPKPPATMPSDTTGAVNAVPAGVVPPPPRGEDPQRRKKPDDVSGKHSQQGAYPGQDPLAFYGFSYTAEEPQ